MALWLSLLLVILGAAASESGCWGAKNRDQVPTNPTPASVATPPKADLYGVVKAVDSAQRTVTLSIEKDGDKPEQTYKAAKEAVILLEEPGQLADLAVGSRVALVFGEDAKTVAEIRTEPFHIHVTPQSKPIEVNEHFDVELRVVNVSELPQSFQVMTCSWDDQWHSSNPRVSPGSWACKMNGPAPVKLAPGEAYTPKKALWMQAKAEGLMSFRMGFTPLEYRPGFSGWPRPSKRTYWSSAITINVHKVQDK
jgi:hypothetical protein